MEAEKIIEVATKFREMFAPFCLKTAIGGGIRRGKPDPHDIELVLCPEWIRQPNLLGEVEDTLVCPGLDAVIADSLMRLEEARERLYRPYQPTAGRAAVTCVKCARVATHGKYCSRHGEGK